MFNFIKRLFNSNFDKEKEREVVRQQNERRNIIEWYRELLRLYDEILEIVFNNKYVTPDKQFCGVFVNIVSDLRMLQSYDWLASLSAFSFDDYPELTINVEEMIANYSKKRKEIKAYRARVEDLFNQNCVSEGWLNETQKIDIENYKSIIGRYENKLKKKMELESKIIPTKLPEDFGWNDKDRDIYSFGEYGSLFFNGIRGELFRMLTDKNGDWVTVIDMERVTGSPRTVMGQINKRIEQVSSGHVHITSKGKDRGAYRLFFTQKQQFFHKVLKKKPRKSLI